MKNLQKAISDAKFQKETIERVNVYAESEIDFYLGSARMNNVNMSPELQAGIKAALCKEADRLKELHKPLFDKLAALELLVLA